MLNFMLRFSETISKKEHKKSNVILHDVLVEQKTSIKSQQI